MFHHFYSKRIKVRRAISPTYLVFLWFGSIILVGSALLWLPVAHNPGVGISFMDAAFTSVSSACVTGLSVVNIAETFSFFGQLVILLLLEMGGLGIMTFAHLGFNLLGRRSSITFQAATADAIFQNNAGQEFKKSFRHILKITLAVQLIGAILLFLALLPGHVGEPRALLPAFWAALFHSVSAFCNGGFMVYADDLGGLHANTSFLAVLLILITLGGLGHSVLDELSRLPRLIRRHEKKPRWLSLHTRVVLVMTAIVIAAGIVGVVAFGASPGDSSLGDDVFLVVSGRTAGFTTVPLEFTPLPSLLIMIALMFIGGSPGSCAGGIKTTSLAIWVARIKANLRNDTNVNLFGYTIAPDLVSRARVLMALTLLWNFLGVFVLVVLHPDERLETLVFEQVSAFGTVGLSMNFTPRLATLSRLWIMVSMFVGRLGPLSIALWVVPTVKARINRPIGRIMIG